MQYDILIVAGTVVDGSGRPPFVADVGIRGDRIEAVSGSLSQPAKLVLRAEGRVVAPGFIDTHSHSDVVAVLDDAYQDKLRQGVTTEVIGNCGLSFAPDLSPADELARYTAPINGGMTSIPRWRTFRSFLDLAVSRPLRQNLLPLVGHGTLRISAMGFDARTPSASEMDHMCSLLKEALQAGAAGLSSGLVYPPGAYSETPEMVALCRVVAEHGGIYATHMRNESHRLLGAIEEAVTVAGIAGVPLVISHLKCMGRSNWGKAELALALIERARARGLAVWADQYPYEANSTLLTALFPPVSLTGGVAGLLERLANPQSLQTIMDQVEGGDDGTWENFVQDAGGWDGVMVSSAPGWREAEGKTVAQLAQACACTPREAVVELVRRTAGNGTVVTFTMSAEDIRAIAVHPAVMVGSDGMPGPGKPHPRQYGTFPRVLRLFVREKQWLTLESAVHKMTGLSARVYGLTDRGLVAPGYFADLVVFDPELVRDTATYESPRQHPLGVEAVIVNGRLALRRGELGEPAGRVLQRARKEVRE